MELVEGMTLTEWLATNPRPDQAAILDAMRQAGAGLAAAHTVGLVHRDFKPDNVLLADGRARVTDFGLARPLHLEVDGPTPVANALDVSIAATRPGSLVGTPAYMSPEQLRGETADARSDQFSFCVALFEALHGYRPFAGRSFAELSANVLGGRRARFAPHIPRWLRRVMTRGLSTVAHRRFVSMTELLAKLELPAPRRIAPLLGLAAAGAGAAAVAGVLIFAWPDPEAPTEDAPATPLPAVPVADACGVEPLPWTTERRAAIEKQLKLRLLSDDAHTRTGQVLDDWAGAWTRTREALCAAPDPQREGCLQRARLRFDALATVLGDADLVEAEHAFEAASALAPPDACQRAVPSSDTGAVLVARQQIATVHAQVALASKDVVETAATTLAVAEQAEFPAVLAEAQLALGLAQRRAGKPELAAQSLEKATVTATAASHEEVKRDAALALVEVLGAQLMQTAATKRWAKIVQADIDTFGDRDLEAALALHRAAMLQEVAEFRDATREAERALEIADTAEAHLALGRALLGALDLDPALEHARTALQLTKERRPDRDVALARCHALLGHVLYARGDLTEALAAFEAAKKARIYPRSYDEDIDALASETGRAKAEAALRSPAAETTFTKAKQEWPAWWQNARVLSAHALWLSSQDRHTEAIAKAREAFEYAKERVGDNDPRMVPTLRDLLQVLIAAGGLETAATIHVLTREILRTKVEYGPLYSFVHTTAADLHLARGDKKAALSELDDAYVTLSSAYGVRHRQVEINVLRRADLAWDLGQTDYARRLYGNMVDDLQTRFGPDHADTKRAVERAK